MDRFCAHHHRRFRQRFCQQSRHVHRRYASNNLNVVSNSADDQVESFSAPVAASRKSALPPCCRRSPTLDFEPSLDRSITPFTSVEARSRLGYAVSAQQTSACPPRTHLNRWRFVDAWRLELASPGYLPSCRTHSRHRHHCHCARIPSSESRIEFLGSSILNHISG